VAGLGVDVGVGDGVVVEASTAKTWISATLFQRLAVFPWPR
jgi:hypothetical protein